jgi:thiazole synthase ThiGH ThiG subunit
MSDPLVIAGREFNSRLFLGTAGYPNRQLMLDAITASGTEMVTASIRRISLAGDDEALIDLIPKHIQFLPNTAGCQTAKDAALTAELARGALETQLDQARSYWRPRTTLPGYRRTRACDRDVGIERLRRTALLHRGPGGLSQAR